MSTALTTTEQQELEYHEVIVERGLQASDEARQSLRTIRDKRLYRGQYRNFEQYCLQRWGFTRQHAYRLINADETKEILSPIGYKDSVDLPINETQVRPLTQLEPDQQREAWQEAVRTAPDGKVTGAHVQKVVNEIKGNDRESKHAVHFSSETPEWYTPPDIINRVVNAFGVIDLDPCSPLIPNVPAVQCFTKDDNGLSQEWFGRVYMNPPYGNEIANWIDHLCQEWDAGRMSEAIALVPARTDTEWFRKLRRFPRCFIWGRLKFVGGDNSAPFPSMLVYLGANLDKFKQSFLEIGDFYGPL